MLCPIAIPRLLPTQYSLVFSLSLFFNPFISSIFSAESDPDQRSLTLPLLTSYWVPVGSPSLGEDVAVDVFDINQLSLPTPFFLFCSRVCFCLYGPFNCISFNKFCRQLSAFSLCSSSLMSVLLVLSTICLL